MNHFYEKFYIFVRSSFGEKEKKDLYDYIWKNYGRKISFYISSIVPYRHYCFDDLYQEVMLKIYNNLHTFNPLHSFKAWIYRIARCHSLDFVKSKEEKRQQMRGSEMESLASDSENDPQEKFIRDELHAKIDRFIESLPVEDREICYLRFYENLGFKEIGEIVDMNVNSVKSRVHQVKAKLKHHLNS